MLTSSIHYVFADGPILVHTTFGDLLRSLDSPAALTAPLNLALSREGFVVAHFPGGHLAAFTANGNLLRHEMHNDKIQGKTDQIELTASRGNYENSLQEFVVTSKSPKPR